MFLGLLGAGLLAACEVPPLVDAETASTINVRNVVVDTSQIKGLSGGREYQVSPEKINSDLTAALRQFMNASPTGNTDVAVTVTKVKLVSPGEALLLGGNSFITGIIKVQGADGSEVLPATEIFGSSQMARLGGLIGAATSPSPQKDYLDTVTGFATSARDRLLGTN
jgi:hypothetical protein